MSLITLTGIAEHHGMSPQLATHYINKDANFPRHTVFKRNDHNTMTKFWDKAEVMEYLEKHPFIGKWEAYDKEDEEDFVYCHQRTLVNLMARMFLCRKFTHQNTA